MNDHSQPPQETGGQIPITTAAGFYPRTAGALSHGLAPGFLRSAEVHADRPALQVAGQTLSYRNLHDLAARLAAAIHQHHTSEPPLTAVFGSRSVSAYAG